ncbi:N-glycosylase/DNA lyase isoform X2 [Mycteria americana]|uniref:N-glycosylase/DNA lyase isoform X2 n=1 Tax=Mycteria americana TaxID=33587 RepID=UPI003F587457
MELRDSPSACPSLWRCLPCPPAELRLDLVLSSGQTFRWRESSPGAWTGVLGGRVWTLRQERERLWYTVYGEERAGRPAGAEEPGGAETDRILRDYFQLDVGLPALYRAWGAADPLFRKVAGDFPGVRVLRQDPVECLLSFICTSNNHISRIAAMIERLCQAFGRRLCRLDARPFHAFPSLSALAGLPSPRHRRHRRPAAASPVPTRVPPLSPPQALTPRPGCGSWASATGPSSSAGARGPSPRDWVPRGCTACVPCPTPRPGGCCVPCPAWVQRWVPGQGVTRSGDGAGADGDARHQVADCVCLMALDKAEAVPVDTHVWRIARQRYGVALGGRSLTPRAHQEIGDFFRGLWGPRAGWAQAVLFCADLRKGQEPAGSRGRARGGRGRDSCGDGSP